MWRVYSINLCFMQGKIYLHEAKKYEKAVELFKRGIVAYPQDLHFHLA